VIGNGGRLAVARERNQKLRSIIEGGGSFRTCLALAATEVGDLESSRQVERVVLGRSGLEGRAEQWAVSGIRTRSLALF
jgi:hypothetical protein